MIEDQKNRGSILSECFPCISYVSSIIKDECKNKTLKGIQGAINEHLNVIGQVCTQRGLPEESIKEIKYALVSYIDEVMMLSMLSIKTEWGRRSLQQHHFEGHVAGESFFRKLSTLRQRPEINSIILEIYLFCLLMGFKGKYRLYQSSTINEIIIGLSQQIKILKGPNQLNKQDKILEISPEAKSLRNLLWEYKILVLGILLGMCFFIYFFALQYQSALNIQAINSDVQTLKMLVHAKDLHE
jgi:type IV/VI secretion system ImpK/VasF family protein